VISEQETARDEEALDLILRSGPGWWLQLLVTIGVALVRKRPLPGDDARPLRSI
jgi:hypothetical protein